MIQSIKRRFATDALHSRGIFFIIFFVSGFSGLIYESIWTHYLKLFLGHAAYAQTLVLAIFMGGMALGSWISSYYSKGWKNLILIYALAEGAIGVLALVYHDVFVVATNTAYETIIPAIGSPGPVTLFKWVLGALLILPQSTLLGMTFPLMCSGVIRRFPKNRGSTIALLYFTNSIGGAIGVLVSGFLLIKQFGLQGTVMIAGVINIILALVVWQLTRGLDETAPSDSRTAPQPTDRVWFYFLLLTAFLTGAASFIYEISWIRMLSLVLGSSTHAFELMLSAFILGIAFGGLWIHRRLDKFVLPEATLGIVQIVMGVFASMTLFFYGQTFGVMKWLLGILDRTDWGYISFNLGSHGLAMGIMLPTTFCAGMTLPLITYILLMKGNGEKSIGLVYSANTIGAIVGVLFAIHIGMPVLGLKWLMIVGAAIDIGLGLVLLWRSGMFSISRTPIYAGAIGVITLVLTLFTANLDHRLMSSSVYRSGEFLPENWSVLKHQDGKTATVSLTGFDSIIALRTNGKVDGSAQMDRNKRTTIDEENMALTGAIPLLYNRGARKAAVIGLGTGITTHVLLSTEQLESVDTIEIERAIVDAAEYFRPRNEYAYSDKRSRIYIEDAKTFFSTYNAKYDIIVSEPSNPWVSGIASLFTAEFYKLISRHLNKDGVFAQWFQLYEVNIDLVLTVLKALSEVFPNYTIYAITNGNILIVAKHGPLPDLNNSPFLDRRFAYEMSRININSLSDIRVRKIGTRKLYAPLLKEPGIPTNSDYNPVLDQNAGKALFFRNNAYGILQTIKQPVPILELLGAEGPLPAITKVTPHSLTSNIFQATLLRDRVLKSRMPFLPQNAPEEIRKAEEGIKQALSDCANPPLGDKVYAMYSLAVKMVSFLPPNDLEKVWSVLGNMACFTELPPYERDWFALFKAVGNRETRSMARLATKLLQDDRMLTPVRKEYLLAVSMLAKVSIGDRNGARDLWDTYTDEIFGDKPPSFLFRLLASHTEKAR